MCACLCASALRDRHRHCLFILQLLVPPFVHLQYILTLFPQQEEACLHYPESFVLSAEYLHHTENMNRIASTSTPDTQHICGIKMIIFINKSVCVSGRKSQTFPDSDHQMQKATALVSNYQRSSHKKTGNAYKGITQTTRGWST